MTYTEAEHDMIIRQVGQCGTLRDKFTREQAERMFKRRDANEKAASTTFADSMSVKEAIDKLIADGFTQVEQAGRWMRLGDGKEQWSFGDRVTRDYIQVALNVGEFERSY